MRSENLLSISIRQLASNPYILCVQRFSLQLHSWSTRLFSITHCVRSCQSQLPASFLCDFFNSNCWFLLLAPFLSTLMSHCFHVCFLLAWCWQRTDMHKNSHCRSCMVILFSRTAGETVLSNLTTIFFLIYPFPLPGSIRVKLAIKGQTVQTRMPIK